MYSSLITGPICGLLVGLYILGTSLPLLLTVLMTTLIVGSLFGWVSEPETAKKGAKTITQSIQQRFATALESRVMIGIVVGLSTMFYEYLVNYPNEPLEVRIGDALCYGLLGGLCMSLSLGLATRLEKRIEPMEAWGWSWEGIRKNFLKYLLISISVGLILGSMSAFPFLISGQDLWLISFLRGGLLETLYLVLAIILINGVMRGLSKRVLDAQSIVTPNQGIWHSARYGVSMAITIWAIVSVSTSAIFLLSTFLLLLYTGAFPMPSVTDYLMVSRMSMVSHLRPTTEQEFWVLRALFWGLIYGAIPGLAAGLYCGGAAYVQHFVLRFLLWRASSVPFNYPSFLDYATERIFLRKVGGGYIFIHRLLLEHFAFLEEKPDPRQSGT